MRVVGAGIVEVVGAGMVGVVGTGMVEVVGDGMVGGCWTWDGGGYGRVLLLAQRQVFNEVRFT